MIFQKKFVAMLLLQSYSSIAVAQGGCESPSLVCRRATEPPTLDGNLEEWEEVVGVEAPLTSAMASTVKYEQGNMGLKCLYDDTNIYFAMVVPGRYRFNETNNHLCASMSFMSRIGEDASFYNMGGCPEAMAGCPVVAGSCDSHTVDLGGHWELRTTTQGVRYGINVNDGTGDDAIANKDDEYAFSPYCRPDDDGVNAGNEWAGAWSHTTSNEVGDYIFEMSRLLRTDSPEQDTQYEPGNTYDFGAAFWDPYEMESGWSDHGHYVTGCSFDWMDLILDDGSETSDTVDDTSLSVAQECELPEPLICLKTSVAPTLDGSLDEWRDVRGIDAPMTAALGGMPYTSGAMQLKCLYDDEHIYFAMEVPGTYRFDPEDNHKCASVSYMTKIGEDAEYLYMGNCPDAMAGCPVSSSVCDSYRVDIGGHWELASTQQRVLYGVDVTGGTGNDLIANKDDEYAFGAYCRHDDDGENAGNEWAGAWSHTSTLSQATARASEPSNSYIFEMSRLLRTSSTETDTQFEAGNTYSFGAAFWDPYETEDNGWTDHGHYVTGCSKDWIELQLDDVAVSDAIEQYAASSIQTDSNSAASMVYIALPMSLLSVFTFLLI